MKLKDYLNTLDKEQTFEFADQIRVTRDYLKQLKGGHSRPGPGLALRIEEVTNGQVAARELRPDLYGGFVRAEY